MIIGGVPLSPAMICVTWAQWYYEPELSAQSTMWQFFANEDDDNDDD